MHLAYLYVKKYQILNELEFNFDSNSRFHYADGRLKLLSKGTHVPADFFSVVPEFNSIECVSAIVGCNGTGKTTVAKILKNLFVDKWLLHEYVVVFAKDSKGSGFEAYYWLKGINGNCRKLEVENIDPSAIDIHEDCEGVSNQFALIYYSPHFSTEFGFDGRPITPRDNKRIQFKVNDTYVVSDASVAACVKSALQDGASQKAFASIVLCERRRILTFLQDIAVEGGVESALELPKLSENAAYVRFDDRLFNELQEACAGNPFKTYEGDSPMFIGDDDPPTWRVTFDKLPEDLLNHSFFKVMFCYIGLRLMEASSYVPGSPGTLNEVARKLFDVMVWVVNEAAASRVETLEADIIHKLSEIRASDWGNDDFEEFRLLRDLLKAIKEYQTTFCDLNTPLPLSDRDDVKISAYLSLMEAYLKVRRDKDFLDFGFTLPFSSGEMAYISMWARLNDAIRDAETNKSSSGNKNLIVFIDEAETAFHPEWQRELVRRTIMFFGAIAKNWQTQLIFSTHSPILLSDIPSGNVVFLKNENGRIVIKDDNKRQGFASNIFDLYRNSFFMEHGTMGAFAASKVDVLLEKLKSNKPKIDKKELNDVLLLAKMIGDPFISRSIWRRLDALIDDDGEQQAD